VTVLPVTDRIRHIQNYIERKQERNIMVENKSLRRLKGVGGTMNRGFAPHITVRTKPHIEVEGTTIRRDEVSGKRFRNISAGIYVKMRAGCSNKVQWQKFRIYVEEDGKKTREVSINLDGL
jgi:hypothetical protein